MESKIDFINSLISRNEFFYKSKRISKRDYDKNRIKLLKTLKLALIKDEFIIKDFEEYTLLKFKYLLCCL